MMKIISYVVKYDYGFAPNPYHGFLTLATCKPVIRSNAEIGDLIIGTGSVSGIGVNKLIYAAIVSEAVTTEEYSINPRFEIKKTNDTNAKTRRGDNIYYKIDNEWKQLKNNFHGEHEFERDLSSERILICDDFWYFGNQAPLIPQEFLGIVKEKQGVKYTDDKVVVENFIAWLKTFKQGELGSPSGLDNTFQAA